MPDRTVLDTAPGIRLLVRLASLMIFLFHTIVFFALAPAAEESYWYWAGASYSAHPTSALAYIHQGSFPRYWRANGDNCGFIPQGLGAVKTGAAGLFLVYRLERLDCLDKLLDVSRAAVLRWERRSNKVVGIQVDFDSPTRHLESYVNFLRQLRARLEPRLKLSITGLADWASGADPETLASIGGVADELVYQLYNGRLPIPNLEAYFDRIVQSGVNFKVGLLDGQTLSESQWQKLRSLRTFHGVIYFLSGRQEKL